jgi:signal transduction histidine kinase
MLQEINAFILVIIASGLIFLIVAFFLVGYYRYASRLMEETVKNNQLKIDHHKALLKSEVTAIEKERSRLARDLHDEVGALLSYISMSLSTVSELKTINELINNIEKNKDNLDKAILKVREISHSLLPPTLDLFGLEVAIEEFINSIQTKIKIEFKAKINLDIIPTSHRLHLYRIVLEFINNSIKHSKCSKIQILFNDLDDKYNLYLCDNGIGYDYDKAIKKKSLGLKNFESRLNALEAEYSIKSTNGVKIEIILSKTNVK